MPFSILSGHSRFYEVKRRHAFSACQSGRSVSPSVERRERRVDFFLWRLFGVDSCVISLSAWSRTSLAAHLASQIGQTTMPARTNAALGHPGLQAVRSGSAAAPGGPDPSPRRVFNSDPSGKSVLAGERPFLTLTIRLKSPPGTRSMSSSMNAIFNHPR